MDAPVLIPLGSVSRMAAGNHEFDRSTPGIEILLDHADFPILSANMEAQNDPDLDKRIAPYLIKDLPGTRSRFSGYTP